MDDLLVFDLTAELDGSLHNEGHRPLLELCLRLLQAPVADADRAGEPLTVVAHNEPNHVSFQIRGTETNRDYGSLDLGDIEWADDARKHEFVTAFAATLRIALNGLDRATPEDEAALELLWQDAGLG